MDDETETLKALVQVLRTQLHQALDAACVGNARVAVLESRLAKLEQQPGVTPPRPTSS